MRVHKLITRRTALGLINLVLKLSPNPGQDYLLYSFSPGSSQQAVLSGTQVQAMELLPIPDTHH